MRDAGVVGEMALTAAPPRFERELPPFAAAVMDAWREVSSCIMRSF